MDLFFSCQKPVIRAVINHVVRQDSFLFGGGVEIHLSLKLAKDNVISSYIDVNAKEPTYMDFFAVMKVSWTLMSLTLPGVYQYVFGFKPFSYIQFWCSNCM